MWWNANENCEAILGGQNAGFALLIGCQTVRHRSNEEYKEK